MISKRDERTLTITTTMATRQLVIGDQLNPFLHMKVASRSNWSSQPLVRAMYSKRERGIYGYKLRE